MSKAILEDMFIAKYPEVLRSRITKMAKLAKCPSCAIKVIIGQKPRFGQRIVCPDCDAILEIIHVNPPLLDWVFEEGDDYSSSGDYLYDEIYFERHR